MSNDHEHCVAQDFEDTPVKTFGKLRYHVFVCTDGKDFCGCESRGSAGLPGALRQELARRKLLAQVKVTIMQCRQQGAQGPVVVVHPDNIWYDGLTVENVAEFVEQQIVAGKPVERLLLKGSPKPSTAVPEHIVEGGDCCPPTSAQTPEERVA